MFFLLHHGRGFTDVGVKQMIHSEFMWHIGRLKARLQAEHDAHKSAIEELKAKRQRR